MEIEIGVNMRNTFDFFFEELNGMLQGKTY